MKQNVKAGQRWQDHRGWKFTVVYVNNRYAVVVDSRRTRIGLPEIRHVGYFADPSWTLLDEVPA